jgi:hypothetical protein
MKNLMIVLGLALGLITLMSSQCNNDSDSDPVDPGCNGIVSVTASGSIHGNLCFDKVVEYSFVPNESVNLSVTKSIETKYSCFVSVNSLTGAGTGTYNCGNGEPGYVELVYHGEESEFYKPKSGTITVTQLDDTHFKATFDVVLSGFYHDQTVNLTGTVSK